jgi:uncharacterized repeat protein (TIGR02543 family)
MSEDRDVSANFAPLFSSLSVTKNTGGSVTSNPAGINCGTTCDGSFRAASSVQLTAAPTAGYVFTGWSGAATGTANPCTVVMNGSKTVNATFALSPSYALTISSDGTGSGTVTSNGTGISCPADCTESYLANEVVTLTATTCTVTMSAVKNVKATFVLGNYALNVSKGGNGQGTVTATGIDCPGDCSESYPGGTSVSMTADPMENSNFTGWTGGITSTTNPYSLTMNAAKNVTANFTLKTYTLTTAVSGQGTISPAAGPHTYNSGDTPEITASAAQGWKFDHWTGDLAGSQNPMELSVNGNKSVTAVFVLIPSNYTLQVTKTGSGSVTADGNGINCGQDCSESYPSGRVVTLTARADSGYTFEGWGGALSGATNPINITMDAAKTVSAVFNTNGTTYLQVENQASFPIVDLRVNGVQILPAGYQMNCSTFSPLIPVTGTKVTFYAGIGYLTPSGTPVTYRGQGPVEIDVVPGEVNPVTLTATLGELLCKFTDRWVYDTTDYCAAGSVNYRLVFYWDGIPENDGKWELYKWINLQEPAHWDLAFSGRATARYWNCGANPVVFKFNDPPYMVDQTYYPQLEVGSNGYDLLHIISPCDQSTILFCRDSSKLGDLTAPPLK